MLPETPARPTADTTSPTTATFDAEVHLNGTLNLLLRLRDADSAYPPLRLKSTSQFAYADWLTRDTVSARWAAVSGEEVTGHVAIGVPGRALAAALPGLNCVSLASSGYCEISKLFVDPDRQGEGTGRALFSVARGYAWATAKQPVLTVPAASAEARRFFASRGMRDVGTFTSGHGLVHVFVDELPPSFISSW